MKFLLIVLAGLLIALLLGNTFAADPGHIVFTWGEWLIQTSLGVFVFAFVSLLLVCSYLFIFVGRLLALPRRYARWREYKNHRQAEHYLSNGMLSMLEGNWWQAEVAFRKAARYSKKPVANYLGAARAAQLQGQIERRDHYLRMAQAGDDNPPLAVALTQAELQLGQKQYREAHATLKKLSTASPRHEQVKLLLLDATTALKHWQQAVELLQQFGGRSLLSADEIKARQVAAYVGLLQETGMQHGREGLQQLWQAIPARLRQDSYLLASYVQERLRFGETLDCEAMLHKAIKKHWEPELVRLFGLVNGKNPGAQLASMEKFLTPHPQDAVLLLSLGRLSGKNNLWGKARAYLEQSIAAQPNPEAYQELADLLQRQGDAAAAQYYQAGLAVATQLSNQPDSTAIAPLAEEAAVAGGEVEGNSKA